MKKMAGFFGAVLMLCSLASGGQSGLSWAQVAQIAAKGSFSRYVPRDATLTECVIFLNEKGIRFDGDLTREFAEKDMARVYGQIRLVLLGEAEVAAYRVQLPEGFKSWSEYCDLNNLNYKARYREFRAFAGKNKG